MSDNPGGTSHPTPGSLRPVNFYYDAPRAKSVNLAGSFDQWRSQPMQCRHDGWWFVEVHLSQGFHQYRFIVDGQPVLDPNAPGVDRDEQNQPVSIAVVV